MVAPQAAPITEHIKSLETPPYPPSQSPNSCNLIPLRLPMLLKDVAERG